MEFNAEQKLAVACEAKNVLVLAGAGTGKTRTIVARTIHLCRRGVDPRRILLLTFTRRAASEMKERIRGSLGKTAERIVASTFHFFCLRMLRIHAPLLKLPELTVIDRDDQIQLMKIARGECVEKWENGFPKAGELANYHSYARNTVMELGEYLEKFTLHDAPTVSKIKEIVKIYKARKTMNGYMDFDDILTFFARDVAANEAFRHAVKSRLDHVLVDEMQDTNPVQWNILDNLRNPARVFCVGDDAQSIYAFRGADFENVHRFTEKIPDSTRIVLNANYRSKQSILDVANFILGVSAHDYGKNLTGTRGTGDRPRMAFFPSREAEARWVVADIAEKAERGESLGDMMVLVRTAWSARMLEAVCVELKLPYRFIGGTSIFESAHVKDLFAFCRASVNFDDELSWVRFLSLFPKLGTKTALRIFNSIRSCPSRESLLERLEKDAGKPRIAECFTKIFVAGESPSDVVAEASEIVGQLVQNRYDHWESRKRDFDLICDLAKKHRMLKALLDTYALEPVSSSALDRSETEEALTIITVHSAKGTEAKHCYLIQAGSGNYPHAKSLGDDERVEEERRILYVAVTRAKDWLTFTSSVGNSFHSFYRRTLDEPPELDFVAEIPETHVEVVETSREIYFET